MAVLYRRAVSEMRIFCKRNVNVFCGCALARLAKCGEGVRDGAQGLIRLFLLGAALPAEQFVGEPQDFRPVFSAAAAQNKKEGC